MTEYIYTSTGLGKMEVLITPLMLYHKQNTNTRLKQNTQIIHRKPDLTRPDNRIKKEKQIKSTLHIST